MPTLHLYYSLWQIPQKIAILCCMVLITSMLGGCGFFSASTSSSPTAGLKGSNVVETARAQIGSKYRPGGSSPQKGFDCSGLVWWSYKQHGVKVPRITTDQAKTGRSVPKKHARAGDIVIFKTGDSPRGLHSGLYCGNGSFVHSPGRGKRVCIDKLSASYWRDKLVAIRRVGK